MREAKSNTGDNAEDQHNEAADSQTPADNATGIIKNHADAKNEGD